MTNDLHRSTKRLIEAWARTASPDGDPEPLAAVIESRIRETDDGIAVVDRAGNVMIRNDGINADLGDLIVDPRKSAPILFDLRTDELHPEPSASTTSTSKPNLTDMMVAEAAKLKASEVNAPMANPWAAETRNLSWQGIIMNRDPDLAERLQRAARTAA